MLNEIEICEEFKKYNLDRNDDSEIILPPEKALEFIEVCFENGLAVIGIDGFKVINQDIYPQIDMILDASSDGSDDWEWYRNMCQKGTRNFIKDLSQEPHIGFSFVAISKSEYLKK